LFALGLIKIISSFGSVPVLLDKDEIFRISNAHLLQFAGGVEIVAALLIFSRIDPYIRALGQLGLALCFVCYRFGLWWLDVPRPCPCLGNLIAWLRLSPHQGDVLAKVALAYLLLGSALVFAIQSLQGRKTSVSSTASTSLEQRASLVNLDS